MLYDNAQLALVYLHAWQITPEPFFKRIVIETLDFVAREITHPDGEFYSSLDADSEGEEGKFYVWTKSEIQEAIAAKLSDCHSKLLAARARRVRPNTDDKILTAWNGLMRLRKPRVFSMIKRNGEYLFREGILTKFKPLILG